MFPMLEEFEKEEFFSTDRGKDQTKGKSQLPHEKLQEGRSDHNHETKEELSGINIFFSKAVEYAS